MSGEWRSKLTNKLWPSTRNTAQLTKQARGILKSFALIEINLYLTQYCSFYQSCGILSCPEHIPRESFLEEFKFFQLHEVDKRYKQEIETEEEVEVPKELPTHPLQRKIWKLFEYPDSLIFADLLAKLSLLAIIMSTVTFCIETFSSLRPRQICRNVTTRAVNGGVLNNATLLSIAIIEAAYVAWFTFEYLRRVISAPKKMKFIRSLLGLVDFLAILRYYITLMFRDYGTVLTSFPVLRIIRLVRVLRVMKLSRYSKDLKVLAQTLLISGKDLPSLFVVLIINIVFFSSVIFYVKNDVKDNDFESIPDAFCNCGRS